MTNLKIFLFLFLNFIVTFGKISDKRLCYDSTCTEPVSVAITLLRYSGDDSRILSFVPNQKVKIFSKSAGSRADLWGAEINGKRGYIPMRMVRETRIYYPKLNQLVDTEGEEDPVTISVPKTVTESPPVVKVDEQVQDQISPNSVTQPYEVVDGTTFYLQPNDSIGAEHYAPVTENTTDNPIVEQSEKESIENTADSTAPIINSDSKPIIKNLNPEIKTENINVQQKENKQKKKRKKNENKQKNYNLNEEQNKINNIIDSTLPNINADSKPILETLNPETKTENINVEQKENKQENEIKKNENAEKMYDVINQQIKNVDENLTVVNSDNSDKISDINTVKEEINTNENIFDRIQNKNVESSEVSNKDDDVEIEEEKEDYDNAVDDEKERGKENSENSVKDENINIINSNENIQNSEFTSEINAEESVVKNDVKTSELVTATVENSSTVINSQIETSSALAQLQSESINELNTLETINTENEAVNNTDAMKSDETLNVTGNAESDDVPSFLSNPLNLFSSREVKENPKVEINTQVPDTSTNTNENTPPATIDTESKTNVPSTELTIEQELLPIESVTEEIIPTTETFTEIPTHIKSEFNPDPNKLSNDKTPEFIEIQHHSSIKQSDLLKSSNDFSFENKNLEFNQINSAQNNIGLGTGEDIISKSVKDQSNENLENNSSENISEEPGFFSNWFSNLFGLSEPQTEVDNELKTSEAMDKMVEEVTQKSNEEDSIAAYNNMWNEHVGEKPEDKYLQREQSDMQSCKVGENAACPFPQNYIKSENGDINWSYEIPENAYNIFLYLSVTAVTVLLFTLGHYYLEKRRKDGKLIANINELEKKMLITTKECQLAQDELKATKETLYYIEDNSCVSNEIVTTLKEELGEMNLIKSELEEQVTSLEIELEKATEAGMEMSKMLNEMLAAQSGNDYLMKTINQLQKQLNDQQVTLNTTQIKLSDKNTENELLQIELQVVNEKVTHLQNELDKMVVNILSVQEDKSKSEADFEAQFQKITNEYKTSQKLVNDELSTLKDETQQLNSLLEETKRKLDLRTSEYDHLKQSMKDIQMVQSNKESLKALLDVSQVKAEVQQLREEKRKMSDKLQKGIDEKLVFEKEVQVMLQEVKILKDKFDEAEREKVEAETRLEVLSSYFKEREAQFQKEINEYESKWMQKEGEASTTIERIKWIQEELQNYKSQNEMLKKEILDQEVSLKSQISMLEKKAHDNWMLARQAERRLEETKQDASQLRNRLTIVEKNLNNSSQAADESKLQNRILSPLESNGDMAVSPLHMSNIENPGSPPLLFPHRDHLTTSPPLSGLPPFMPPPPGVPFMPPPLPGVPPFMPPPPALFPGDHRPPPLGRMSSPPLHGRYSPDSRTYSPYDRDDSPPLSPTYTEHSDYRRRSPPPPSRMPPRNFSPYNGGKPRHWDDERDYRGQHSRNKSRPHKGLSSGSGNSNESLENSGRHSGRV